MFIWWKHYTSGFTRITFADKSDFINKVRSLWCVSKGGMLIAMGVSGGNEELVSELRWIKDWDRFQTLVSDWYDRLELNTVNNAKS